MSASSYPDFERPPVVETVLSVRFREIPKLVGARVGQFWERYLAAELPDAEERPPYQAPMERSATDDAFVLQLQLSEGPPMSRTWLLGGNSMVQVQSDWFAYNWRRTPSEPDYIRYPAARQRFAGWLESLDGFVAEELGRSLVPTQCEVTYVNQIELAPEDLTVGPLGGVIRGISTGVGSFLPVPEHGEVILAYPIRSGFDEGEVIGRLHLSAESTQSGDGRPGIRLVLTARGRPIGEGIPGALAFCDLGREWVVKGFRDSTTAPMWERWGLREGDDVDR